MACHCSNCTSCRLSWQREDIATDVRRESRQKRLTDLRDTRQWEGVIAQLRRHVKGTLGLHWSEEPTMDDVQAFFASLSIDETIKEKAAWLRSIAHQLDPESSKVDA